MNILISNDDGIYSPGLRALAEVASEFGRVRLVAPDVEQSAMSHAITILRPLHYHPTRIEGFEAYRVDGTPADCVALGAYHWGGIDLVLSGINLGLNIGHNIWHSGTVAAAKQAAFLGIPAIAFSAPYDGAEIDYAPFREHIREVIGVMRSDRELDLLNVNFPMEPQGLRWTRQSVRHYDGQVVPGEDPMGRRHFWLAVRPVEAAEEGTDRRAVEEGFTSVTPLRLDLSDLEGLERGRA
jgi:5'-nucleotidase